MNDPLQLSFEVRCSAEHAFKVWTSGIGTWWPRDHSVTGATDLQVVFEGCVGGRLYERANGVEHDWGEVTVWDPPARLAYRWHLGRGRAEATDVNIRFVPHGDSVTVIEIEHYGWERLGAAGPPWRERNEAGWATLLPHFAAAVDKGD